MNSPHYLGHRQRLRERFHKTKGVGLADYELLELMLFHNFSRGDTKTLAKELLHHFKNFNTLFNADREHIKSIKGAGDAVYELMSVVGALAKRMTLESLDKTPLLNSFDAIKNYAKVNMGFLNHEELRVLFLNGKGHLIREQMLSIGTINETPIYPREIIRYGLMIGAVGMIMIHNHPSGDPKPSAEDLGITYEVQRASQNLELHLLDHIIIGKDEAISLKSLGLL